MPVSEKHNSERNLSSKRRWVPLHFLLLFRGISIRQLCAFALANILGLAIVLTAVQFMQDVLPMFTSRDSFMKPGQFVVSKRVSEMNYVSGRKPVFSQRDIDELRQQPFVSDVATFTPSRFSVFATVSMAGMQGVFGTEMFFESIPDQYIDVVREDWTEYSDAECPIILPQNYLNLYNFGYASSRDLPSLTPSAIAQVPIQLTLAGDKAQTHCTAHVVGFSKQINTILVPEAWLQRQNERLCHEADSQQPSRLIVQASNLTDSQLTTYLDDHSMETEQGDDQASRTASFLRTVSLIVLAVGVLITLLAFYILMLSIFILLHKHTVKIDNLLVMGYPIQRVARPFQVLAHGMSLVSLLAAIPLMSFARSCYLPQFGTLYDELPTVSTLLTILVGIGLTLAIALLNHLTINGKVKAIWHIKGR